MRLMKRQRVLIPETMRINLTVTHMPVSTASTSSRAVIAERGIREDTRARVC